MGAYQFEDGQLISLRKSTNSTLRYRVFNSGKSGRLYPVSDTKYVSGDGFSTRDPESLSVQILIDTSGNTSGLNWTFLGSETKLAKRINKIEPITFDNGDITLNGHLSLPEGEGPFPAIVLVHGSGDDKATDYYYNGDFFAAHGIACLTFDKRGTGNSDGIYTFDYYTLANDVIKAVEYLECRSEIKSDQIGLSGYSQGSWVAPLAASLTDKVKFVIVNYGMIESAIEEAIMETRNTLRNKGVNEEHLKEVEELTLATVNVVASGFKTGWKEVRTLDKKYKKAIWRKKMKGTTVHTFLKYPKWLVKIIGPGKSPFELDWSYESTPILDNLTIPMAWLLPESDTDAPNVLTKEKLKNYKLAGKPFYLEVFPNTDHTMLVYKEVKSERIFTKYSPEYFKSEITWVNRLLNLNNHNFSQ
jgi:dienelactone hydrolase